MSDEAQEREYTLEDRIEYLRETLQEARIKERRYNRLQRLARGQKVMIASKDGFTLVEDLDEYLQTANIGPLTTKDILREGMEQLEEAFAQAEARQGATP